MWQDTLKEFLVNHHELETVRREKRQHKAARKAATDTIMAWLTGLPEVTTAMSDSLPTFCVTVGDGVAVLRRRGGFKQGNVVSDSTLTAAMESVTDKDILTAAKRLGGSVRVKDVIAAAVMDAVARIKETYMYVLTSVQVSPPRRVAVVASVLHPPDAVVRAVAVLSAPDPVANRAKALQQQEADLNATLLQKLPGASNPNYVAPLSVHMTNDERQQYVLRNSTTVRKPSVTGHRIHEMLTSVDHALLNAHVTPHTVDAPGVRALTQKLTATIRDAILQWQARHAQVVSRLRIKSKPADSFD